MPNHVTTRCRVTGPTDDIAAFKKRFFPVPPDLSEERDDDGPQLFDFDDIIPMPEILQGVEAGDLELSVFALTGKPKEAYGLPWENPLDRPYLKEAGVTTREELVAWMEENRPGDLDNAKRALAAHAQTGYYDWYDWSVNNWGTKWNSYHHRIVSDSAEEFVFMFETAWSFPSPIFIALAKEYPKLAIECWCFDEMGNFAGHGVYAGGVGDMLIGDATDEFFEKTYGKKPQRYDDDDAGNGGEGKPPMAAAEDGT